MSEEFERTFSELLSDALIGKVETSISSDTGDPSDSWSTSYEIQAYKERTRSVSKDISRREKTESTYLIMCPTESSSGSTLNLDRTMSIVFGSTYSSDLTEYKIEDFDAIADDHYEIEASVIYDRG